MGKTELKEMILKAFDEGRVHFVSVEEVNHPEGADPYADVREEAEHIAKVNKILYDAHVDAGFDALDALEMTISVIRCK